MDGCEDRGGGAGARRIGREAGHRDRPRSRAGRRIECLLVAATLALVVVACPGREGPDALSRFEGEPEDFDRVALESLEDPAGLRAWALERLDDDSPARVGAIFALTLVAEPGPSMDALRALLEVEELTERLQAAAALAARGEPAGLTVLVEALDSEEILGWPEPPQPAWSFARFVLLAYTGQDLGLADAEDQEGTAAAKADWEVWLAEHGPLLRWHEQELRFEP